MKLIYILLFTLLNLLCFGQRTNHFNGWENKNGLVPIRINYVIIQRNDSTGNFPDDENTKHYFELTTTNINKRYANLINTQDLACYQGKQPFIPALNIHFEFSLIFIQNTNYWNNHGSQKGYFCPNEKDWWLNDLDKGINTNPSIKRGINIYLTEDGELYKKLIEDRTDSTFRAARGACSEFPNETNWKQSSRLHYPNEYSALWYGQNFYPKSKAEKEKDFKQKAKGLANGLAHELGHSLGLGHNNEHHGSNQCWHSIMHQGGDSPRDYLQPTEIAKVNYKLTHTNLTSFIDSNYFEENPFLIDSILFIESKTRLFQNLEIVKNGSLEITDTLFIPNQASLTIRKKGKLNFTKQGIILHLDNSQVVLFTETKAKITASDLSSYRIEKKKACGLKNNKRSKN